jgi:hypothetical protein
MHIDIYINEANKFSLLYTFDRRFYRMIYFFPFFGLGSSTYISGLGFGRPPHVMSFLTGAAAFPGAAFFPGTAFAAGAFFSSLLPPLNNFSRMDGGIMEPGQLNFGIALIAVCLGEERSVKWICSATLQCINWEV